MNPQVHVRALSGVLGGLGVVVVGLVGMSRGAQTPAPVTVVAPATGVMSQDAPDDATTTTSSAPSFRPIITATVPPPPTD